MKMSEMIAEVSGCRVCTSWGHTTFKCNISWQRPHSAVRRESASSPARQLGSGRMFTLYTIPNGSPGGKETKPGLLMEDLGSTDIFITHKFAKQLGLPSEPASLSIKVLEARARAKRTRIYRLSLEDMREGKHIIQAISMDSLMDAPKAPEAWKLIERFQWLKCITATATPKRGVPSLASTRARMLHIHGDSRVCVRSSSSSRVGPV